MRWFGGGTFDAWWIPLTIPTADVERALPRALGLIPAQAGDTLTVLLTIGRQRDVRPDARAMEPVFGFPWRYSEAFFVVPDLVRAGDPRGAEAERLTYLSPLFLDHRRALVTGVWGYGFDKRRTAFEFGATGCTLRGAGGARSGASLLAVEVQRDDAPHGPAAGPGGATAALRSAAEFPVVREIERMLAQDIVSRSPFGPALRTRIAWGGATARVAPAALRLTVHDAAAAPLAPVVAGTFDVPPLTGDRLGAARVERHWRIAYPTPLRSPRP